MTLPIALRRQSELKVAYKMDVLFGIPHPSLPGFNITEAGGALQLECVVAQAEGPAQVPSSLPSSLLFLLLMSPLGNYPLCSSGSTPTPPPPHPVPFTPLLCSPGILCDYLPLNCTHFLPPAALNILSL